MELEILAAKLQECVHSVLSQYKKNIKGNIYILLEDKEIIIPLSAIYKTSVSQSGHAKKLGGYHDTLKLTIYEDKGNKSYNLFTDFFYSICMNLTIKESTRKNYLRTLETLKEYAPFAYFTDIDKKFIYGYEIYLKSLNLKANTIIKHMKQLRKALHDAAQKGFIKHSIEELFSLCTIKTEKTYKESLTAKELMILYHYLLRKFSEINERDREVLSGFLFSCFTGLRFSDICNVEYSNIRKIRNKKWLFLKMKKTEQNVFIPIEQMFSGKALEVMKLFHRTRGKLFYMPSNAICNRIIKRIYRKLFTTKKNISFHTARHTTATLLLYYNTPLTTIKEILGHSNIKTTEIYADINEATIYNSISKIKFKELEMVERRIAKQHLYYKKGGNSRL